MITDIDKVFKDREGVWNEILSNQTLIDSSLLILGDSKAEDLTVSLALYGPKTRYTFVKTQTWEYNSDLVERNIVLKKALDNNSLQGVILTNTWKSIHNKGVIDFIRQLETRYNFPIIVISTANFNDVSSLAFNFYRQGLTSDQTKEEFYSNVRLDWKKQSDELYGAIIKATTRVKWYDKLNAFCNKERQQCDLILDDGTMIIYDTGHLSRKGAEIYANWLIKIPELKEIINLNEQ